MSEPKFAPQASALPPRPQAPEGYDCCGGGCADCDLTRYYRELASWMKLAAALTGETSTAQESATKT